MADGSPGHQVGTVTSGAPSPTLGVPIAMAYLEPGVGQDQPRLAVDIRGQAAPADLTDLPFYRRSK
jgi:aminomethyltransferase